MVRVNVSLANVVEGAVGLTGAAVVVPVAAASVTVRVTV